MIDRKETAPITHPSIFWRCFLSAASIRQVLRIVVVFSPFILSSAPLRIVRNQTAISSNKIKQLRLAFARVTHVTVHLITPILSWGQGSVCLPIPRYVIRVVILFIVVVIVGEVVIYDYRIRGSSALWCTTRCPVFRLAVGLGFLVVCFRIVWQRISVAIEWIP